MVKIQNTEQEQTVPVEFLDKVLPVPAAIPIEKDPKVNPYYVDSMSSAQAQPPLKSAEDAIPDPAEPKKKALLEAQIEVLSDGINKEIALEHLNFERLRDMVYKIVQALGRKMAKEHQNAISELKVEISLVAVKVQNTYNTWKGVTVTVISATISMAGGLGGLAPLLPMTLMGDEVAKTLGAASQGLGSAGTSLGGIASIFNSSAEGERQVLQIHLKRLQDTEEEKKSGKHKDGEMCKEAANTAKSAHQVSHEAFSAMATPA